MNPCKTEVLCCRCNDRIRTRDGTDVKQKESMVYLGASLSADGRIDSEVARRIGAARADFRTLQRVWAHASLAVRDKVRIYDACVVSSLTCGLQTAWPPVAARRRLDGFHAKCLRRICNIPPSFISHVSNADVLRSSHTRWTLPTVNIKQLDVSGVMPRLVSKTLSNRATHYIRCRPDPSPTVNIYNMSACKSRGA